MKSSLFLMIFFMFTAGLAFAEFEIPEDWQNIGAVEQWRAMDGRIFRIPGVEGTPDMKVYGFEQKSVYHETATREVGFRRIDLDRFLELGVEQQQARRERAGDELRYVAEFRLRIAGQVMLIRGQTATGWGDGKLDHVIVGDVLGRLQSATGLDPTNVYAWHLLSYFRTGCGDLPRALEALDGCDEALALLPADALPEVRHRAALDRAWILRDLGFFGQATDVLRDLDPRKGSALEQRLLQGLIAAQTGDFRRAKTIAEEVRNAEVRVFQRDYQAAARRPSIHDPQAWPTRPSNHLKSWILALSWLYEGQADMAAKAFPEFQRDRHYEMGRRFFHDAGRIYEATGRIEEAREAWLVSHLYVPYMPFHVYRPYAMDPGRLTGRGGSQPFVLAYDTHLMSGSRLAFGTALVAQALFAEERDKQIEVAQHAVSELEICLRTGSDPVAAALGLGYAHSLLGDTDRIREAADAALTALDRPGQDQARRPAAEDLLDVAAQDRGNSRPFVAHGLGDAQRETPEQTLARLRRTHWANPGEAEPRRELARFLVRTGRTGQATNLVEQPFLKGAPEIEDWILALELDHQLNRSKRALQMLAALQEGRAGQWPDARLWTAVGVICRDNNLEDGRKALEYALELDPENLALKDHVQSIAQ